MQLSPGLSNSALVWVRTNAALAQLGAVLQRCRLFGVDLEHHHMYSYAGTTCLVQVSTDRTDYLIDTMLDLDLSPLQPALANPYIVKVIHGCASAGACAAAAQSRSRRHAMAHSPKPSF